MRGKIPSVLLVLIALLGLAFAGQTKGSGNTCDPTDPPWGKQLIEPESIVPNDGVLDTTLVVRKRELCVPVWSTYLCKGTYTRCFAEGSTEAPCNADAPCENAQRCVGTDTACSRDSDCTTGPKKCAKTWGWDRQDLRSYGFPKDPDKKTKPEDPDDPNIQWGFPGPTLRARSEILKNPSGAKSASNKAKTPGTRIKIGLYNYLEPQKWAERHDCDPAGPRYEPKYPECFHGPEITNLHYHGTHVSPQPHQDYVLLSLWPFDSDVPESKISEDTQVGMYQTDINPLPWNQAPGTHWYHPHKHGSTALQVLNGLSGALIITGPFDDWLDEFYDGKLVDRILIVQQVGEELNYLSKGIPDYPPQALINGLATPQISMRPGEIQRFRFIGATMQASAALEIGFDQRIKKVRQIAQDGVQFAWQNYDRQPYRDSQGTFVAFKLAPGNRADFLIQAPMEPGTYLIEHNVFVEQLHKDVTALHAADPSLEEQIPPDIEELEALVGDISERLEKGNKPPIDVGASPVKPLLFTIEVQGQQKSMDFPVTQATDSGCAGSESPERCWPRTPAYLEDLPKPSTAPRYVAFSMKGTVGPPEAPSFYINGVHYDESCTQAAMTRYSTEDWHVSNVKYTPGSNDGLLAHPFHIHINPFQVVRNADRTFEPPYVWQDTIALPVISLVTDRDVPTDQQPIGDRADAEAKCPTICDAARHSKWTGKWTSTTCKCQGVNGEKAGPIWDNRDAEEKCPKACAADNATWNGNWRTTVPGKMSECDCEVESDSVLIRQRFDDYTGAYVIHCHFLGHEDRGMMWNIQTVCDPDSDPWTFGTLQNDGGPDNCPGSDSSVLPCCGDEPNRDCGPQQ